MRSFFLQIFLSFWLATVGIFIAATSFAPRMDTGVPDQVRSALDLTMEKLAQSSLENYRARGCAGIAGLSPQIAIADKMGKPLCSGPFEADVAELLADVRQRGQGLFLRNNGWLVHIRPIASADGGQYFLIERMRSPNHPWWPHLPTEAIPVSVIVTFLFAYILTRPVRALSVAFRKFSAGDMDVRLPISPSRWKDLGGADIRTLMLDFNHMAKRVKELVEAQKMLVRDISHELRSPLARLQLALEIAREESPDSIATLDQASAEADRVNALIGEMLTLSLMESMRQLPEPEPFSLGEIFETLLPDMNFEAETRGSRIAYVSSCDDLVLRGQPEMLRRALENIIRNAIRYTPAGACVEITASISESAVEKENSLSLDREEYWLVILVADRGPGIPEACLPDIFRPFYRVDMAREGTTGGFGVGLAIAERAVHLHAGSIRVENRKGGGLAVIVRVPWKQEWVSALNESLGKAPYK